ncbi:hypothetical protein NADFUDRAFT_52778 [Nadsonia fulvescens var. elongata DSM 6958]|uniref:Exonuclease domain-containing protein n=1 Tax=Nadsonia fulvescens var. elongata DSM 6958 TaxID=857566 RepID=A0A1E3PED7_9ASCO|nr:hypothetical protein NADFUDRAFT_52778 [Nadsonia fulvescens var. elongata DSM 6958]
MVSKSKKKVVKKKQKDRKKTGEANAQEPTIFYTADGSSTENGGLQESDVVDELSQHVKGLSIKDAVSKPEYTETEIEYALCMDIEATFDNEPFNRSSHEIIDLPVILVDLKQGKIIDKFHTLVRPTIHRILSIYCSEYTGIFQEVIDKSPSFKEALAMLSAFLSSHGDKLKPNPALETHCISKQEAGSTRRPTTGPWEKVLSRNYIWVTHGRADFQRFFCAKSCKINNVRLPAYMCGGYVDIRPLFEEAFKIKIRPLPIAYMLDHLNMKFEGKEHDGMADTQMIAKILIEVVKNITIQPTAYINMNNSKRYYTHVSDDMKNYSLSSYRPKFN